MALTRWIWYQDGLQGTVLAPKVPGSNDVGVYVLLHHSMSRGNLFCGFCTWPLGWLSKHHAPRTAPLLRFLRPRHTVHPEHKKAPVLPGAQTSVKHKPPLVLYNNYRGKRLVQS